MFPSPPVSLLLFLHGQGAPEEAKGLSLLETGHIQQQLAIKKLANQKLQFRETLQSEGDLK